MKYFYYFGGALGLTLGVSCIITAGFGSGSWDGVNVGLGKLIGVPFGTIAVAIGILSAILAGILRKKWPNFLTVLTAFLLGYLVNFWLFIIQSFDIPDNFWLRLLFLVFGIGIQGIGTAFYLLPQFAPNALDDLMMAMKERFHLSITVSKVLFDTAGIIISYFVGGPIGVGTIFVTFLMGPHIDFWYSRIRKEI